MRALKPGKWLFIPRFIIYFAVVFALWVLTAPPLSHVYAYSVEKIVMLFDRIDITGSVVSDGEHLIITFGANRVEETTGLTLRYFTFNTVFLIALIMAVPGVEPKLRFKILLLGLAFLIPVQLLRLVVYIFNHYDHVMAWPDGSYLYSLFWYKVLYYADRILQRVDGQMIPIIIWASLYYYYLWHHKLKALNLHSEPSPD